MKRINHICRAILALVLCANFGTGQDESSVSGAGTKPSVNFKGTILDNTGKTFNAEHITISGLFKQIPLYAKPKNMQDEKYNPPINTIRLDLAEVTKIAVPQPNTIHLFNNRKYIEINVTSKDASHTQNSYLIDNGKKILCDQVNAAGPIERELQFPAIQEITISSYEKNETEKDPNIKNLEKTNSMQTKTINFQQTTSTTLEKKPAPKTKPIIPALKKQQPK